LSPTELDTRRRRLGLSNDEYTTLIGGDHGSSVALGGPERITATVRDQLAAARAVNGAVLLE
jgi:hypothetical protein